MVKKQFVVDERLIALADRLGHLESAHPAIREIRELLYTYAKGE